MPYPDYLSPEAQAYLFPDAEALHAQAEAEQAYARLLAQSLALAEKIAAACRSIRTAAKEFERQTGVDPICMPVAHGMAFTVEDLLSGTEDKYLNTAAPNFRSNLEEWVEGVVS